MIQTKLKSAWILTSFTYAVGTIVVLLLVNVLWILERTSSWVWWQYFVAPLIFGPIAAYALLLHVECKHLPAERKGAACARARWCIVVLGALIVATLLAS